ncbi:flagellar hook-basal body complex protein FliE [Ramlibacter sp.]|uniref:flagellar hook-basal body complex protein FliE n=1 Tax=Ramlibacter sp. TaxID=1917967 RepID=UPI003D0AFE65
MAITPVTSGLPASLADALKRNAAAQSKAASLPLGGGASIGSIGSPSAPSFAAAFDAALRNVSASQAQAASLAEGFQSDPSSVSLEQAMVAMQKSQIGFQSALHVRNRLVSAYSDIMNMQV